MVLWVHRNKGMFSSVIMVGVSQYNILARLKIPFLDASTHLYKRLRPSVRWSVGLSVRHASAQNSRRPVEMVRNVWEMFQIAEESSRFASNYPLCETSVPSAVQIIFPICISWRIVARSVGLVLHLLLCSYAICSMDHGIFQASKLGHCSSNSVTLNIILMPFNLRRWNSLKMLMRNSNIIFL